MSKLKQEEYEFLLRRNANSIKSYPDFRSMSDMEFTKSLHKFEEKYPEIYKISNKQKWAPKDSMEIFEHNKKMQ